MAEEVPEAMIVTEEDAQQDQSFMEWVDQDRPHNKINFRREKRQPFEKLGFNPNHIDNTGKYARTRKT